MDLLPRPKPLSPEETEKLMENGAHIPDLINPEAFSGAYVEGSYAMPLEMLPGIAGCSDRRAIIAASILKQHGFDQV